MFRLIDWMMDLVAAIRATTDLRRLDEWLDMAVQAASLDEFQRLAQAEGKG